MGHRGCSAADLVWGERSENSKFNVTSSSETLDLFELRNLSEFLSTEQIAPLPWLAQTPLAPAAVPGLVVQVGNSMVPEFHLLRLRRPGGARADFPPSHGPIG